MLGVLLTMFFAPAPVNRPAEEAQGVAATDRQGGVGEVGRTRVQERGDSPNPRNAHCSGQHERDGCDADLYRARFRAGCDRARNGSWTRQRLPPRGVTKSIARSWPIG